MLNLERDSRIVYLAEQVANRRRLIQTAVTVGVGPLAATVFGRATLAQSSTPEASPLASPVVSAPSISRTEFLASLKAAFPFEEPKASGGQIILASNADMASMHPYVSGDIASTWIQGAVFESLVGSSPVDGSLAPGLADSWELAEDGLTCTFHLNPNITWHDGQPLTTADVLFSYDSVMNELSPALFRGDVVQLIDSYRVIDDYTFEITATAPSALFFNKVVMPVTILPKHIWESVPIENWGATPGATGSDPSMVVGSGPFRFVEWVPGDHVTLTRNENYWLPEFAATIDTYTMRIIPEPAATVQALTVGEIDLTWISPSQVEDVEAASDTVDVHITDTWGFNYLIPNLDAEKGIFFNDVRVRQAVYYALDREAMLDALQFGYGVIANGPQPPLSPAYAPEKITTHYTYDPEKAKALLEEAGWIDTNGDGIRERDGIDFACRAVFYQDQEFIRTLTYVQQALAEVGIKLELEPVLDQIVDVFTNADFDLSYTMIVWAANGDQGNIFRSDAAFPNGFNLSRWSNAEYDALDDQQLVELDPDKRLAILEKMSNIVNDDVADIILTYPQQLAGAQKRVRNFFPTGFSLMWSLNWMWIDPEA